MNDDDGECVTSATAHAQNLHSAGKPAGKVVKSNSEGGVVMLLSQSMFTQMKIVGEAKQTEQ